MRSPRSDRHEPDADGGPRLTALASLRRFVRPRAARERCELCGAALAAEHPHLVEPATRRLVCACDGLRHPLQRPGRRASTAACPGASSSCPTSA